MLVSVMFMIFIAYGFMRESYVDIVFLSLAVWKRGRTFSFIGSVYLTFNGICFFHFWKKNYFFEGTATICLGNLKQVNNELDH